MKKTVLYLDGISCPVCTEKLQDMLNKMKGVEKADVSFNTAKAKISYNEANLSSEEIIKAIEKMGYKAKQK